jgi:hypothetical protein
MCERIFQKQKLAAASLSSFSRHFFLSDKKVAGFGRRRFISFLARNVFFSL